MTGPIRAEVRKLASLRLPWALTAGACALSAVIGVVGAHATRNEAVRAVELVRAPAQMAFFVVIVLAVLASAGEFQHGSIRPTLLAVPRRSSVLVAKAAAAAASGAAVLALATATTVVAGTATRVVLDASAPSWGADALGAWCGAVALGALWAVAATAIGLLTRSTASALVVVLLWRFVAEGILPVVTRRPELGRWMPSGAGDALLGLGGDRLAAPAAALVLLGYLVVLLGLAAALFLNRDPV